MNLAPDTSLKSAYEKRLPLYRRLEEEVLFTLEAALDEAAIKTHSVTARVKNLASLEDKAVRKNYGSPLDDVSDLVGARVVTLFLADLPKVRHVLEAQFEVVGTDDKIEGGDPSTFGYMSEHYVARLGSAHTGPRYNEIQGIPFEIQVRTILMDAWANVSHYLAYKGEASIPARLRRDFHALSGLFYVADQHFEMFFKGVMDSRSAGRQAIEPSDPDINLETVQALLQRRYKDRLSSDAESVSEFVEEVTQLGYSDLEELHQALTAGDPLVLEYEIKHPPHNEKGERFEDVGAARMALAIADPRYADTFYDGNLTFAPYRGRVSQTKPS